MNGMNGKETNDSKETTSKGTSSKGTSSKETNSNRTNGKETAYLYAHRAHETEEELCRMELRALTGGHALTPTLTESQRNVDADRSPFVYGKMKVEAVSASLDDICHYASGMELPEGETFKVLCLKEGAHPNYRDSRELERKIGACVRGKADMHSPAKMFALVLQDGLYRFGEYEESGRVWRAHIQKPHAYSTGLGVPLARAAVNIAAAGAAGRRMLDPCCGMGTVLIEGLSMGLDMTGCDLNPLAVTGARGNLRHYGYPEDRVQLGDMRKLEGKYDTALLDMPYNLCSVITSEETLEILAALRRLTARAVVISTQPIEAEIREAGFSIEDACTAAKGSFARKLWLCR